MSWKITAFLPNGTTKEYESDDEPSWSNETVEFVASNGMKQILHKIPFQAQEQLD